MSVCIVGSGLVSLSLAKALVNEGIYVDFFSNQKKNNIDPSRTIGISKTNIDYFNKNILNINKLLWKINSIEIYTDNLKKEKIINFDDEKKSLFSIIKNIDLYHYLTESLSKNNYFKKKKNFKDISIKNYDLVINCDGENHFVKKYFFKKIKKNYNSFAYTTVINHKKIMKNDAAIQIFTKKGPLAFLPISNTKTSVVYSVRGFNSLDLKNFIKKYNTKYKIVKIDKISRFQLNAKNLRNYHFKNILAFGELLHKLHPLAGQGFNMSIRDIKLLLDLIKFRLNHGLELNSSVCLEFENKIKHKNYLFSKGIDLIYEFFNLESKIKNPILGKSLQFLGKNKTVNKFFSNLADNGLVF